MTNIVELFKISLPYQAAALQVMVGEANFFAEQLEIPVPTPIKESHLVSKVVLSPELGLSGCIQTTNVAFSFWEGRLQSIVRLDILPADIVSSGPVSAVDIYEQLSLEPPVLDGEEARALVAHWMRAVAVDLDRSDPEWKGHDWRAAQRSYATPAGRVSLPIFDVYWATDFINRRYEAAPVEVVVLGSTKELVAMKLNDISAATRPMRRVPDADELNASTEQIPPLIGSLDEFSYANLEAKLTRPTAERFIEANPGLRIHFSRWGGNEEKPTLERPQRINVYRVGRSDLNAPPWEYSTIAGPLEVPEDKLTAVSKSFLDPGLYKWVTRPPFAISGEVRYEVLRDGRAVDFVVRFDGARIGIYAQRGRSQYYLDLAAAQRLLALTKELFPHEGSIQALNASGR